MHCVHVGQRVLDPLELEGQKVVSHVGAGNKTQFSVGAASALNF